MPSVTRMNRKLRWVALPRAKSSPVRAGRDDVAISDKQVHPNWGLLSLVVVLSFPLPSIQPGASVVVRSACSSLFVESRQAVGELLDDDLAAQLHTRRQVAGFDREFAVGNREVLDLLPAIQFQVQCVHVPGNQFLCLLIASYLGEGLARQTMLAGPVGDRFVVEATTPCSMAYPPHIRETRSRTGRFL